MGRSVKSKAAGIGRILGELRGTPPKGARTCILAMAFAPLTSLLFSDAGRCKISTATRRLPPYCKLGPSLLSFKIAKDCTSCEPQSGNSGGSLCEIAEPYWA